MNGLVNDLTEAQADLQNALGFYRLSHPEDERDALIEDRMVRALARLHARLDILGHPMMHAATHADIPEGPTPNILMDDLQVDRYFEGGNITVRVTHAPTGLVAAAKGTAPRKVTREALSTLRTHLARRKREGRA